MWPKASGLFYFLFLFLVSKVSGSCVFVVGGRAYPQEPFLSPTLTFIHLCCNSLLLHCCRPVVQFYTMIYIFVTFFFPIILMIYCEHFGFVLLLIKQIPLLFIADNAISLPHYHTLTAFYIHNANKLYCQSTNNYRKPLQL